MCDDWEKEDYVIPVLHIRTQEQVKRLEEKKLVEESDNNLTRNLFQEEAKYEKPYEKPICFEQKSSKELRKKNLFSKQKENEQRQKEISQKIKKDKIKRHREKEIFGEAELNNKYLDYENKFTRIL